MSDQTTTDTAEPTQPAASSFIVPAGTLDPTVPPHPPPSGPSGPELTPHPEPESLLTKLEHGALHLVEEVEGAFTGAGSEVQTLATDAETGIAQVTQPEHLRAALDAANAEIERLKTDAEAAAKEGFDRALAALGAQAKDAIATAQAATAAAEREISTLNQAKAMSEAALADANAEIQRLHAEVTRSAPGAQGVAATASDVAGRLRALLRDLQFAGPKLQHPSHQLIGTCVACGGNAMDGHRPDCRVKAELA